MRFDRYPGPRGQRPHSPQRVAAARGVLERERAKTPLFPDFWVKESVEERLERQDRQADDRARWMRTWQAAQWRKARRRLSEVTEDERHRLLQEWNAHRFLPGSPEYFLDFLSRKAGNMRTGQ